MQVKLIVVDGQALVVVNGKSGAREAVIELPAVIGRSRSASVTIGDLQVSRQHCFLEERSGLVMVRDNGSRNGTIIDGRRIGAETVLRPGSKLTVGPLTFVVVYESASTEPDTGWMPSAQPGQVNFEAMLGGAQAEHEDDERGDDGEMEADDDTPQDGDDETSRKSAQQQEDEDLDAAVAAALGSDEDDGEGCDAPAAADPSPLLGFLPPSIAADAAPLLPPTTSGASPAPTAAKPETPAKPGSSTKPERAGKATKTDQSTKPAVAKNAPQAKATPQPDAPAEKPAAASPIGFDWLNAGNSAADEGGDEADEPAEDAPEAEAAECPEADDSESDDTQSPAPLKTPAATPAKPPAKPKDPKAKRSWWPFGKKQKTPAKEESETAEPATAEPDADEPAGSEPLDDEVASKDAAADDAAGANAGDAEETISLNAPPGAGKKSPSPLSFTPPNDANEDDSDDDADESDDKEDGLNDFFKGIGPR